MREACRKRRPTASCGGGARPVPAGRVGAVSELPVTIASFEPAGEEMFHSLRRELGVESFGINLLNLRPGQRNRVHIHSRQEEVYIVLAGTLTLFVEGERLDLERGRIARVAP